MAKVNDIQISNVMSEIARRRWAEATDDDRKAQGEMLAEARKSISKKRRVEIARKAAAASTKVRSAKAAKKR